MSNLPNNLELGSAIIATARTSETAGILSMDDYYQFDAIFEGKPIVVISDVETHPQVQIDGVLYSVVKRDTILSVVERLV